MHRPFFCFCLCRLSFLFLLQYIFPVFVVKLIAAGCYQLSCLLIVGCNKHTRHTETCCDWYLANTWEAGLGPGGVSPLIFVGYCPIEITTAPSDKIPSSRQNVIDENSQSGRKMTFDKECRTGIFDFAVHDQNKAPR